MNGSITQLPSGSYRLLVSGGFDGNGKRIRYKKTIKAENMTEANKKLSLFIADCERGLVIDLPKCRLKDFIEQWMNEHVKVNLAPKTIESYEAELKNRIIPALGNIKLDELKPLHLIKFYNSLDSAKRLDGKPGNLSGRTKQNIHRILSSLLSDAVKWQLLNDNPAKRVEPPKSPKKRARYYDEDQLAQLLSSLEGIDSKWKTMTYIAIFTGMRKGEITGLEWQDIDFEKGIINIERTSQYITGKGTITKSTKNESSTRSIVAPKILMDIIKQYKTHWNEQKLKCGDKWNDTTRLFIQWNGKPIFPDTFTQWFNEFILDRKLPKITPHGLRHTSATILINQGLNIKAISARLGHADTTTTLNIYAHALKSADREAADRLDTMFSKQVCK